VVGTPSSARRGTVNPGTHSSSRVLPVSTGGEAGGPRWHQVMTELAGEIAAGGMGPGERLPVEAELAVRFGVNRLTVRQALAELARAGAIRTVHGRGSFVAERPYRFRLRAGAPSIVAEMRATARTVTQELVAHAVVDRSELPEPTVLPDARLLRLDTVMAVDGEPWSRDTTWLSADRFAGVPAVWTPQTSLTGLLTGAYGITTRRSWRRHCAEPASAADAAALGVPLGTPLLVLTGANTDGAGAPLTLVHRRSRGDRIEYEIDLDAVPDV
jgi:GntR family transcriptional regulator